MASLLVPGVSLYRNPQFQPGLDALVVWLLERDYCSVIRWGIIDHVATRGTLEGSGVDPEDMAEAEAVFVDALPALDPASDAWDREDFFLDCAMLAAGSHPWPIPVVGDDDRTIPPDAVVVPPELEPDDFEPTEADWEELRRWELDSEARRLGLTVAPIRGGSPAAEPTGPTVDDVAEALEHCRWLDELAAIREAEDRAPLYGWE